MIETTLPSLQAFEQKPLSPDCGPAAVRSIYASITGIILDEKNLKIMLGTNDNGTRPEAIKKFFEEKGLIVVEAENQTIDDIKRELLAGKLCLVVYQAWGTEKEYLELESGHYSVIYGIDEEDVYLMDPSIHKDDGLGIGKRKLSLERFLANWRDKDENGRVYIRWCLAVGMK